MGALVCQVSIYLPAGCAPPMLRSMRVPPNSPSGVKDRVTVNKQGERLGKLPTGASTRNAILHTDERGSLCEIFDPRWGWHPEPMVFSYFFTLRPGKVKGWGMHRTHDDRYFLVTGEMKVVLYDGRADSPTHGLVSEVVLSEWSRQLLSIPAGVWHANYNIGSGDCLTLNFPTRPYDHENPDKNRLPIDTDEIPYRFPAGVTGG